MPDPYVMFPLITANGDLALDLVSPEGETTATVQPTFAEPEPNNEESEINGYELMFFARSMPRGSQVRIRHSLALPPEVVRLETTWRESGVWRRLIIDYDRLEAIYLGATHGFAAAAVPDSRPESWQQRLMKKDADKGEQ